MSQKKVDYSKSLIYKIVCNDTNIKNVYIGSTTSFRHRKKQHKHSCYNETNNNYNMPVYKFIRENGGWDNFDMILVDYVPCETKLELHKIERTYIEKYDLVLNIDIPTRSDKEYYEDNKEKIIQNQKEYYKDNKEKIRQYKKEYYKKNKEEINKKRREYTEKHKEEIRENNKETIKCDICNSFITKHNLKRHQKSKKCLSHIKSV